MAVLLAKKGRRTPGNSFTDLANSNTDDFWNASASIGQILMFALFTTRDSQDFIGSWYSEK